MLVTRAIPGVLQAENNYAVIINNGPSRRPVFTGGQKMPVFIREHGRQHVSGSRVLSTNFTRVYGPCRRAAFTGK